MSEEGSTIQERALNLSNCLSRSRDAYSALLELERAQGESIASGDLEAAASKIDEKTALVADIQAYDRELHKENQAWQAFRDQAPPPLRGRLQAQLDQLQKVMADVLELQSKNETAVKEHGEAINAKLVEIQKRKAAHKGYQQRLAGDAYQQSKFYDKDS